MLEEDGGEEEVADLDGEAHDLTDPQPHHLAGEEEEEEDRLAGAREKPAPPGRRSTPGRRRGSPGNTTTAPAAELTSSMVTPREWSVERRRRPREGRWRGISRPWISPREKHVRKFHHSRASPRELRCRPNFSRTSSSSAWPPKNEILARFSKARRERGRNVRPGVGSHPRADIKHSKMAQLGLAGRSEPISNTPLIHGMSVRSFSSVFKDFASASSQAHIQVFATYSRLRPLVFRVFFFGSSWIFGRGFCRVSVG
jgi:hypothetical protein